MKDVIVVAGYTHYDYLMLEYEKQLIDSAVPYYFETVEPMPAGPNSMTMERKIGFVRAMAEKFSDYQRVVISDAFDVLFFGSTEELLDKLPQAVLISAERNLYPEPQLAAQFTSASPWRFVNAGLMSGSPDALIGWCNEVSRMSELHILDQAWLNRRAAEQNPMVMLDEETRVFYTVSSTLEDGALRLNNGVPFNANMVTYPNFFHFSGRCSVEKFKDLLVNGTPLE